jgi:hypothetical protein
MERPCRLLKALPLLALLILTGCPAAGVYRSARTLEPGETDLGANLSASRVYRGEVHYGDGTEEGKTKDASVHGIVSAFPEIHVHRGVIPNLEAGARLAPAAGYLELEGKYRFFQQDGWHVAVAPVAGMAPWGKLSQVRLLLPFLGTYDLNDHWGITAGLHAGYRWVHLDAVSEFLQPQEIDELRWSMGEDSPVWGGGIGFDWRTTDFYLRPMLTVEGTGGEIGPVGQKEGYGITTVQLTFSGGWTFGKEIRRFKDAGEQLDTLIQGRTTPTEMTPNPPTEPEVPVQ